MSYRSPGQALTYCATHRDTARGMCQKECRIAYNVPSDGTPTAAADWYNSNHQHLLSGDSLTALRGVPEGALLRWIGGSSGAGHVALYRGGGKMWSTDLPIPDHRGLVNVSEARTRWGLRLVGWTPDIDGALVVSPPPPTPQPKKASVKKSKHPTEPHIHAAPSRKVFHDDHPVRYQGGIVSDTIRAAALAAHKGYHWIDSDVQITHRTRAGAKKGHADHDLVLVNAHGAPFLPAWLKGRRFEQVSLEEHSMNRFANTLRRNAQHGVSTEAEIKDWRGYAGPIRLRELFEQLARDAKAAYGKNWRNHVTVKVLTNLAGGIDYALKIAKYAHAAGFRVMILARGKWVFKRLPAEANAYVSWVRGARPGLYPKTH